MLKSYRFSPEKGQGFLDVCPVLKHPFAFLSILGGGNNKGQVCLAKQKNKVFLLFTKSFLTDAQT